MKFDKIEVGQTLYDVHSYRMGNTTMRSIGTWSCRVISIDHENRTAMISWNSNPPRKYSEFGISKLKKDQPYLIKTFLGGHRRPNRAELAEYRASLKVKK